jgi:hypothetical protein
VIRTLAGRFRAALGRSRLDGRAVTGDTAAGAVAEENFVVKAGEDSAERPTPSGRPVADDCEQCLEHGASLPAVQAGKHYNPGACVTFGTDKTDV